MTEELGKAVPTAAEPVGTSVAPIDGARKNGTITPLDKNLPLGGSSFFSEYLFLQRPRIGTGYN